MAEFKSSLDLEYSEKLMPKELFLERISDKIAMR
jgi:hypothetical protein